MNKFIASLALAALSAVHSHAQTNLVPNPDFSDKVEPLKGWRTDFPYEGWYVDNVKYVKVTDEKGGAGSGKSVVLDLPNGVATNQGGKIESAFLKVEPGATYRAEIDCMTNDYMAKLFAEVFAIDPKPSDKPDKFRVPARNGMPALVTVYRADFSDPPANSKVWTTCKREFKVPAKVLILKRPEEPSFITLKVVVYGVPPTGKSYFTNFRLYKIK